MYCVKKMTEDLYWVGASERRLNLFENAYPLTNGVSYNSYLLLDEKTVLIDTVDKSVSGLFFENVDHVLAGRKLDYLIVQHMEPDHAATIWDEIQEVKNGEVDKTDNVLVNAPHPEYEVVADTWEHSYTRQKAAYPIESVRENKFWVNVARVDNTLGDRKLLPTCYGCFD